MKKLLTIAIVLLLGACTSRPKGGEPFPQFDILLADSTTRLNTASIPEGAPIVLLYFSPDCEHCQKETAAILQHMQALKNARFFFVTNDPLERLKTFKTYYKLDNYANITLGQDDRFFLLRHFKGAYPPYLVLYDKQKQQRAAYQGETSVDTIISFVNSL
jgi:hypothetical protein